MFISKATCAVQPVLRRMTHPQATYATSEVGSGQAPGGARPLLDEVVVVVGGGGPEALLSHHRCTDFLSHCFTTGDAIW